MTSAINTSLDFEQLAFDHLLTRTHQFICIIGTDMHVRWTTPAVAQYKIDAIGRSFVDFIHPEDLGPVSEAFSDEVLSNDWQPSPMGQETVFMRLRTPTGYVPFEVGGTWVSARNGERLFVATLHDVSGRYEVSLALRTLAAGANAQECAEAITKAAHGHGGVCGAQMVWVSGGVVRTAGDLGVESQVVDEAWPSLAELTGPTALARPAASDWCYGFPFHAGDERLGTLIVWGVGKEPILSFAATVLEPLLDLASLAVIRSRQLGNLNRRATTDHVTGLLNRHAFFHALDQTVERSAVIYVDLDGFKSVNDRFGHTLGDRLLLEVAQRLRAAAGQGDRIGRLGGDEFAIACIGVPENQVRAAAELVRDALNQTMVIEGHKIASGASLGVAYSADSMLGTELIDRADQALLIAKVGGKGRVHMASVADF